MQILEGLGEGKEVPAAWLGFYTGTCFRTACALFGCGKREEGYEYLERAYNYSQSGTAFLTVRKWIREIPGFSAV